MGEEYCKKDEKGVLEYPSCSVCLTQIEKDAETILVPCGHMFHEPCILKWLDIHNTCPVCRFELPTDDEDYERARQQRAPNSSNNTNNNNNNNNSYTTNSNINNS